MSVLTTPDNRYIVVRGRLWRAANPGLDPALHSKLVSELMAARRDIKALSKKDDSARLAEARDKVNRAKVALGERGPVWWTDGAADYNRYMIKNTPYAQWYFQVDQP